METRQRLHVAGHSGTSLPSAPRKNLWTQHSAARQLYVCPYMGAAVKEFLEAYGPVPVYTMTHLLPRYDPIEHALDDFGRAIINRDNLPLTLHELAQAPTKDLDALDIETIGNLVDSFL